MHKFISYNGEICISTEANIPALSSAALYGWGIFTSMGIYDGQPFLWKKHWQRLGEYAMAVGIDIGEISERDVYEDLLAVIRANKLKDARARITCFDNAAGFWNCAATDKTNILIATADFRQMPERFTLTRSPFPINSASPLAGIKSCNYLENLLAWERAKNAGFDEAVRLNEHGEVASVCVANIFWVRGDKLYTPSLRTGALEGTTRAFVLEQAAINGIEYLEVESGPEELLEADECFLTSAGIGIRNVEAIDETRFESSELTRVLSGVLEFQV
jgi:branched-subunit amino acid aminotransferase/4-amino-4-deoxychorismate lyase